MTHLLDAGIYTSVSEIGDAENISKSYVSPEFAVSGHNWAGRASTER
jgi:hypothetical protein